MQTETSLIKPYGYIYKITNKVNNKCYIGQSINIRERFGNYKRLECKDQPKLYRAFVKYGIDAFSFDVINMATSKEELDMAENLNVSFNNSMICGYNCTEGGNSGGKPSIETKTKMSLAQKGRIISEETKRKMSIARQGKMHSLQTKLKISNTKQNMPESTRIKYQEMCHINHMNRIGTKHTEETKLKMSLSSKGRVISEETKQKMSISKLGKILTKEHKTKISEALRGKDHPHIGTPCTEENKRKMSDLHRGENNPMSGKKHTEDAKKQMSTFRKGRKFTEEHKLKLSESARLRYSYLVP